jgi:hypothetical protein
MAKHRGPGRPKKTHEMHKKNPKADLKKDAKETGKAIKDASQKGKKLVKDGMKEMVDKGAGIWAKTVEFMKALPMKTGNFFKNLGLGLFEFIKNMFGAAWDFIKSFGDPNKVNSKARMLQAVFLIISFITVACIGVDLLTTYFTAKQILIGSAVGTGVCYGTYRLTLDEEVQEATEPTLGDAFGNPFAMLGQAAA